MSIYIDVYIKILKFSVIVDELRTLVVRARFLICLYVDCCVYFGFLGIYLFCIQ